MHQKKSCDGISLVDTYQGFRGTYYSHLRHFSYPDDEGTRLLWNVGRFLCNYDVISQKTELLMDTIMRTPNPIKCS